MKTLSHTLLIESLRDSFNPVPKPSPKGKKAPKPLKISATFSNKKKGNVVVSWDKKNKWKVVEIAPKKRKKKSERDKLEDQLDELFRREIRAVGFCMAAGLDDITCGGSLQTCHIVGRANRTLRWDHMNALCMCGGHHIWYTKNQEAWRDFIKKNFPEQHKYTEKIRNIKTKRSLVDLQQMIDSWQ